MCVLAAYLHNAHGMGFPYQCLNKQTNNCF